MYVYRHLLTHPLVFLSPGKRKKCSSYTDTKGKEEEEEEEVKDKRIY
jgi:hypothetical protein